VDGAKYFLVEVHSTPQVIIFHSDQPPRLEKFSANSVFQGKRNLLKNPECKKCNQYSEKFRPNSFSGQAQVVQNRE